MLGALVTPFGRKYIPAARSLFHKNRHFKKNLVRTHVRRRKHNCSEGLGPLSDLDSREHVVQYVKEVANSREGSLFAPVIMSHSPRMSLKRN